MFSFNQRSARWINRNIDSTSENEDAAAAAAASANQGQQRLQQQPTSSSSATESSQLLENPHPNYSMMNDNNDGHFGNSDGNNRTGIRGVLNNFNVNREHDPEEQSQEEEEEEGNEEEEPFLLNNSNHNQTPPEPPPTETPPNTNTNQNQNENEITRQITTLTNRLRVIFYTLYIPIIPLSALLILLLLQLTYESLHSPTCSYPLRTFSFSSMFLALYIPNHKIIKRWLFNYSRERDGLVRPRRVRIYDQCFHMLCLTYLYMDMVLIETCKDDVVTVMVGGGSGGGSGDGDGGDINADINADMNANNNNMTMDSLQVSTCETTCPDLYPLLQKYDLVLRIFSVILVMPLICLPFVYVWIMRRINTAEELLQMDLGGLGVGGGMDDDFLGGGVLVKDVMDGLREVVLVGENANANACAVSDSDVNGDVEEGNKRTALKVIGKNGVKSWTQVQWKQDHQREGGDGDMTMNMNMNVAKECCICMNDFEVENEKSCTFVPTSSTMCTITPTPANTNTNTNTKDTMISNSNASQVIVETKCLHLFHRECIGAWIGGVNWEEASLSHRARRRCCPLCREDLAIVSSTSSGGGGSGSGRNRDENGGANAAESA